MHGFKWEDRFTHTRERLASRKLQHRQYRSSSELVGTTEGEGGVCGKFNTDPVLQHNKGMQREGCVGKEL